MFESVEIKVILVGESHVGKTCIVQRAISGVFNENTTSTLGAAYASKHVTCGDHQANLQIWDTAGQERYRGMTPMYFRGANIALVVFALDSLESFQSLDDWFDSIESNSSDPINYFLVGNKNDLEDIKVSPELIKEKADKYNAIYREVSAKTGDGIEELFADIPKVYFENTVAKPEQETKVEITKTVDTKPKGCC